MEKFHVPTSSGACSKDILSLLASVPTQSEPWIEPRPGWKDWSGSDFKEGDRQVFTPRNSREAMDFLHFFFLDFLDFFHIFFGVTSDQV